MAKAPSTERVPLRVIHSQGVMHELFTQEEIDLYMQAKKTKDKAVTDLCAAAVSGDIALAQSLLDFYAKILPAHDFSAITLTALFGIATQGTINKQEMFTMFLAHPLCDHTNHAEGYDIGSMFSALSTGDIAALTLLFEDGRLLNASNKYGLVVIAQILQSEDVSIIDLMVNHKKFNANTYFMMLGTHVTLLDIAVITGNEYAVQSLLNIAGLEVLNIQRTLGAAANNRKNPDVIKVLLNDPQERFGMLALDHHGYYGLESIIESCNLIAIDLALSKPVAILPPLANRLLCTAVQCSNPLSILTRLLSDPRFQEGLLYNNPDKPSVLSVAMSLNSEGIDSAEARAVIDLLKAYNAVPDNLTHAQLREAFNQNDLKLFAALLAPDADVNVTNESGKSMLEDIACIIYQDRGKIDKANACFKMLLEHPMLNMTWDIAEYLIGALRVTDCYGHFQKIKMMLTNERVISTGILHTENNGKTLLEKFADYEKDILDILKENGAICLPTVKKFIDSLEYREYKLFTLLLEFSNSEIVNGVDANGKTLLFHLLHNISRWEGRGLTPEKSVLESMLRHPELNMEGVELNSPQDAMHIIKALQENPLLVPASPISFICHSGSVAAANTEISQLITQNVFHQESACDDVCSILTPEIASSIVMGYLGAEMYRGSASASAAETDAACSALLGDADHS